MTKKTALASMRRMQKRGFNRRFERKPKSLLDKEVWFCVVYNSGNTSFDGYKNLVERLRNGEKIFRNGKKMTLGYGYGKILGRIKVTSRQRTFFQIVLYNTVRLGDNRDREASDTYETCHETWIQLGEWAKELLMKEKVLFS